MLLIFYNMLLLSLLLLLFMMMMMMMPMMVLMMANMIMITWIWGYGWMIMMNGIIRFSFTVHDGRCLTAFHLADGDVTAGAPPGPDPHHISTTRTQQCQLHKPTKLR